MRPRFFYDKGSEELCERLNAHRKDQISWLIELAQYNFSEMNESEAGAFFHNEISRGLGKYIIGKSLALYALPFELAEQYFEAICKVIKNSSEILSKKDLAEVYRSFTEPFLKGLSSCVVQLKYSIEDETGDFQGIGLETSTAISLGCTMEGVFRLHIGGTDPKGLGAIILGKLLDGYGFDSLKACPNCNRLFFSLSKKKKFCTKSCAEKANEKRQLEKADYQESRKMISRKAYLKKKKGMTNEQIKQKWKKEGVDEKWIGRLFTKKKT